MLIWGLVEVTASWCCGARGLPLVTRRLASHWAGSLPTLDDILGSMLMPGNVVAWLWNAPRPLTLLKAHRP